MVGVPAVGPVGTLGAATAGATVVGVVAGRSDVVVAASVVGAATAGAMLVGGTGKEVVVAGESATLEGELALAA